ncbi:MAG TPA: accessory colonization factor, partial [Campylobacterales bacterium]|nr:accessory colonization factor [Campylobacterales bacterium]
MYSKILLTTLVLSLNSLNASDYQPKDGIISLYGAGGPHTALIKVAKLFTKNTGTKVNVHFGPERKWT